MLQISVKKKRIVTPTAKSGSELEYLKIFENISFVRDIDICNYVFRKSPVNRNLNANVIPGMLMIGANAGIVGMTKEHLGLALALSVPVFVVVTKIDMCPPNVLQENLKLLIRILKSPGCRKVPVTVKTSDDVVVSATNFVSERLVQCIIRILYKKRRKMNLIE